MNLSLESLNEEEVGNSLTIESLTGQEALPLGNDRSNTERSAFTAIAASKGGGDMVSMYQMFKGSLDINADDQPVKDSLQKIEQGRQQRDLASSGNLLADPSVPDGVKYAIPAYLQNRKTPDPRKIVAEQVATEDNIIKGKLEGANQENARFDVFGGPNGIDAHIEYKKEANKLAMAIAAKDDSSTVGMYLDLFATMMPGHQALNTAAIREQVGSVLGEDPDKPQNTFFNIFTQFSNKREMRDMLNAMPPEQRMVALKQSLDIIQSNYGPGLFDGNEYAAVEAARELIGDPEVTFSNQSKTGAVVTDTLFNLLSVIGVSPKWFKPSMGALGSKTVPKVVFTEGAKLVKQAAPEEAAAAAGGVPKAKVEQSFDIDGVHMTESQIAEKRVQLSALSENKFDRATTQSLRSEQASVGDAISKLEAEKLANKENASQLAKDLKTSRKEAIRKTNKIVDEQIEEQKAKLNGIKDKLKYGERGYQAEAELSRFEQAVQRAKPVVADVSKAPKSEVATAIRNALDEAGAHNIVGGAKPSSVVSMLAEANPSKATAVVKAAVEDETGELAKVTSGTSREELANNSAMPSPSIGATVQVKPVLDVDQGTLDLAVADSGVRYTDQEMKSLREGLEHSITSSREATLSSPLSQLIEDSDNGFRIKGLFIDGNVGFNSAVDAVERTLFALQHEGVSADSVQLMKRTPTGYEPIEAGVDINTLPLGDYAVQVDHNWNFQLETGFEEFNIKRNWLDWGKGLFNSSVTSRQGTLTRHIFSPQQMFHKDLMLGVIPAFDKAAGITKRLAKLADEFNKPFGKLSKKEQKELADYIHKANVQRIPFHAPNMLAAGYTHDQVNVLSNWKRYWDTAYVLENADKVRTMQLTGYKMFLHKATGAELFVKPLGRNAPINGKVYDADLDMIVDLSVAGKKHLYDNGGTVAVLRDHITDANGEVAKYVAVKNNVGSYTREFNENDRVLNYIDGYYSVRHDAPLFVVQNIKDKSGRILYKKAVAEAGSLQEAEQMARAISARTQGHTYVRDGHDSADFFVREDVKNRDALDLSADRFDSGISAGRSSQRYRGTPLESYDPIAGGQSQYVQNPLEAMQQTAFSLGNRLATRPMIETLKARYMSQYADLLAIDPATHIKGFPTDPADIGRAMVGSKRLTDARTMWEYINQLEHGYESAVDVLTRSVIGIIADGVGHIPLSPFGGKVEAGLRELAASGKPTSTLKAAVYYSSLVSAHMGTFLMQSMQSLANLSDSFLDYRLYRDLSDMLGASLGLGTGKSLTRGKQLWKEWEKTGHSAAVDIHGAAFMGGAGSSRTLGGVKASRPAKMAHHVGKFIQGFYNKGELVNQYTAWLAKRLDFERVNKRPPSTARELDQVHAEARALTYTMNRAGQMAYNENTLNVNLQFFQVMHKALFDPFLNRTLSGRDRLRLTVAPLAIFGLPLGVRNHINSTIENSGMSREDKEAAKTAMEWSLISKMLGSIDKRADQLDFSKYNPLDYAGAGDRIATLFTYPEMFTRTPGGSLVDKGLTAVVTMSRFIGLSTADSGIQPNSEAVMNSLGYLLAGTSNSFKGSMLMENGVLRDKSGREVVDDVGNWAAWAQRWMGMTPKEALQTYAYNSKSIEVNKEFKEDLATFIKNAREQLALNGVLADQPEYAQQLMGAVVNGFRNNPKAMDELMTQLKYDLQKNGQSSYLYSMMKASGWMEREDLTALAVRIPDKKQREAFIGLLDELYSGGEYQ